MDFDPVNREAPAPRYELESGSEDEFEQQQAGDDVKTHTPEPISITSFDGSRSVSAAFKQGAQLVVLVGNAGAALLSSLGTSALAQRFSLRTQTEQYGAIAVTDKCTVALVAPAPQLRSSRFHELARSLVEATKPSSIVIVDSYSPQEQLYRDPFDDEKEGQRTETSIRYLATPQYRAKHTLDPTKLTPLRSPEAATGLGAAFLSKAVISNVPAILALLEDVSFQSHIQLYGSLGAARLSPATSEALRTLTGLHGGHAAPSSEQSSRTSTLLDFAASRRVKPAKNLAVLGDGAMYI